MEEVRGSNPLEPTSIKSRPSTGVFFYLDLEHWSMCSLLVGGMDVDDVRDDVEQRNSYPQSICQNYSINRLAL